MQGLYGWDQSAQEYMRLYRDLTGAPEEAPAKAPDAPAKKEEAPKKPRAPRKKKDESAAPSEKKTRAPRKKKTEE